MKRLAVALILASLAGPQAAGDACGAYGFQQGRREAERARPRAGRNQRRQPSKLVRSLELAPGATVADLGTGAGFLLPHLAEAVGPEGRVLAQDITEKILDRARKTAEKEQLANVDFILGTETDPKLPENGVDLVVTVNTYHHFDHPAEMLAGIRNSLRAGGRLAIVEYYKESFPGHMHMRLDKDGVIKEVEANGFHSVSDSEHVPGSQYMVVFELRRPER